MKVLHVSDCYLPRLGGIETQVHDLARRQRAAGHEATVLTATPRARHDGTRDEVVDGVPVHRLAVDLPFELPVHPWPGPAARALLRAGGFDVVHVHAGVLSPFAFGVLPVVRRERLPLVVTVHSMWGPATPAFAAASAVTGFGRGPEVLTAVSRAAARAVERALRAPVAVLPNGIDPDVWRVGEAEVEPRSPDDVVLAAVMRLAPRKRPLPLLRMLRAVRERVPPGVRLRALVLGEGPERASMERYLHRHGLDWVELPGRVARDRLRELYRRVDLFVAPARLESFGIAALEARTAGIPVVATSAGGVGEFVADGVEGLLAGDDAGLVDALARLASDPALRARMAGHNRAVPPPMAWPGVLARCDELYAQAAGRV